MKTDKFEKFVQENRQGFGPEEGTPDVWDKITKREPEARIIQINWRTVAYRAASVVVIFVASYYFHAYMSDPQTDNQGLLTKENLSSPLFSELLEADLYYTAQIKYKKEELFNLTNDSPGMQMDVNNELGDLDAILLELKEDLNDDADNQEVVEAMMQNYMLKLEILEDMMEQIKAKQEKNNEDETGFSI
jgi:hypothetical protein